MMRDNPSKGCTGYSWTGNWMGGSRVVGTESIEEKKVETRCYNIADQ